MFGRRIRRSTIIRAARAVAALALVAGVLPAQALKASAAGVENPKCADLGYAHEVKVDPPASGMFASADGAVTVNVSVTATLGGAPKVFDWTSRRVSMRCS